MLQTIRQRLCSFSNLDQSRFVRPNRSSPAKKERTDLSGRSVRGHLVLISAERCRPRLLLQVNTLHRWAAQMGVVKSDFYFCQMHRSNLGLIKNMEHFAQIDWDWSRFEKEHNQKNRGKNITSLAKVTIYSQYNWLYSLQKITKLQLNE